MRTHKKPKINKKNKSIRILPKIKKWKGKLHLIGDENKSYTKHTFIIKTKGNRKTLTILNNKNKLYNHNGDSELKNLYPKYIEDKPYKGYKVFNINGVNKISILISIRGSHNAGPRMNYKEQLVCNGLTLKEFKSLKQFLKNS
jgi:hypothetical protein